MMGQVNTEEYLEKVFEYLRDYQENQSFRSLKEARWFLDAIIQHHVIYESAEQLNVKRKPGQDYRDE
jgi:hypothetical protein